MRARMWVATALMLALVMVLGAGCAKKTVQAPPDDGQVQQQYQATPQETQKPGFDQQDVMDPAKAQMMRDEAVLAGNKIFFDFDKYDLKDSAKEVLKAKAAILKKYSSWKMLIEGHCDQRGTEEYNLALGERRAKAAYEFLVLLGVDSSRLKIVSFGEERPVADGDNETAWAKNRRCEFQVFK